MPGWAVKAFWGRGIASGERSATQSLFLDFRLWHGLLFDSRFPERYACFLAALEVNSSRLVGLLSWGATGETRKQSKCLDRRLRMPSRIDRDLTSLRPKPLPFTFKILLHQERFS